jgi:hypothetical protein
MNSGSAWARGAPVVTGARAALYRGIAGREHVEGACFPVQSDEPRGHCDLHRAAVAASFHAFIVADGGIHRSR